MTYALICFDGRTGEGLDEEECTGGDQVDGGWTRVLSISVLTEVACCGKSGVIRNVRLASLHRVGFAGVAKPGASRQTGGGGLASNVAASDPLVAKACQLWMRAKTARRTLLIVGHQPCATHRTATTCAFLRKWVPTI